LAWLPAKISSPIWFADLLAVKSVRAWRALAFGIVDRVGSWLGFGCLSSSLLAFSQPVVQANSDVWA
jgi:hypothetical protein